MNQKPPPKTASERQSSYRKRLAQQGKRVVTIALMDETIDLLRLLSRENNEPTWRVLHLGALAARRELLSMAARQQREAP